MNKSAQLFVTFGLLSIYGVRAFGAADSVEAAESAQERFLKEAPQQWLEYRRIIARHTEGTSKSSYSDVLGERKVFRQWDTFSAIDSDRQLMRYDNTDSGLLGSDQIETHRSDVFNPRYRFRVKSTGPGDKRWSIREAKKNVPWHVPDDLLGRNSMLPMLQCENSVFGKVILEICLGQRIGTAWLPLLVASSDFKLVRATDFGDEGQFVKIEFEFEPTEETGGGANVRSGMAVLDPKRYWLIREVEAEAAFSYGRGMVKVTNEFTDGEFPVPFVSRHVLRRSCAMTNGEDPKPLEEEWVYDLVLREVTDPDETQFELPAFGLPDPYPPREELDPSPWRLPLVGLSIVLVLFVVLAGRAVARRRATGGS